MEFDLVTTVVAAAIVVGIGVVGLLAAPIGMTTGTVLMMVLPSMAVFGLVMLLIGVKHGEYRAR